MDIEKIQNKLREFSKERDWEQFHSPKNLSMALSVEVAELVEIFQWSQSGGMDEIANQKTRKEIEKEIADIFIYTLKIADLLNMDLEKAALEKIEENAKKYPIESSKGKAIKYDQL
jgi:dCTP diphosphatase|tara:strand:- start:101 stop:448 length:348 start_codon:yes stop_codon:yes gene_type:complete